MLPGPAPSASATPGPSASAPAAAPPPVPAPPPRQAAPAPLPPPPVVVAPVYGPPPPGYWSWVYVVPAPPANEFPPEESKRTENPSYTLAETSPFLHAMLSWDSLDERFHDGANPGIEAGVYFARHLRLAADVSWLDDDTTDQYPSRHPSAEVGYARDGAGNPSILFGGSVGVPLALRDDVFFSPGLAFYRSNVGDYGSLLAVNVPIDFVVQSLGRFTWSFALGSSFGGQTYERCTGETSACDVGERSWSSRPSGFGGIVNLGFGLGLNEKKR
jgi:hypothetical protein